MAFVRTFLLAGVVLSCAMQARADSSNDLLMPGQVIQGTQSMKATAITAISRTTKLHSRDCARTVTRMLPRI